MDYMEKIINAASGEPDTEDCTTIAELLEERNKTEVTKDEEKAEIRMWADWAATTVKTADSLTHEGVRGVYMRPLTNAFVLVFSGIHKLAYMLGVKAAERYDPESERMPFVYEFKYRGITFEERAANHIPCPEEYKDAQY